MMKVIVLCLDLCCAAVLPLLGSRDDGVGGGGGGGGGGEVAKKMQPATLSESIAMLAAAAVREWQRDASPKCRDITERTYTAE